MTPRPRPMTAADRPTAARAGVGFGRPGPDRTVAVGPPGCDRGRAGRPLMQRAGVTHPTITVAQVHAALAYDDGHRDEIRAAIADEARFVDELIAKAGPSSFQAKVSSIRRA
jgi:hypothetical protein